MRKSGFALVELVVAMGVFSIIVFAAIRLFLVSQETAIIGEKKTQAQALAGQYLEELRNLRKDDWASLVNGRYILQSQTGNLNLVATTSGEMINNFTRYLEIGDAFRDQTGNLIESGGSLDLSTKKITTFVSWTGLFPSSVTQTTYLTRYLENIAWTQTTVADFETGEMSLVEIVDPVINDGEIQLRGGCFENPAGAWIYDDQFQNTWQIHPSAEANIKEVTQLDGKVYEGKKALGLVSFSGASTKLRNKGGICTLGFTRIEFYAYNNAAIDQSFQIGGKWEQDFVEVTLPPQSWKFISLPYGDVSGGSEVNFDFIFFKEGSRYQLGTKFYLDNITLAGGVGGFYQMGTLTSSVLDTGHSSAFNKISFNGQIPSQTQIGFQTAIANSNDGPWVFSGPGGTGLADDLYTAPAGESIWLGANIGQFFRYKAYLKSLDGENTPILEKVTVNYSP